MYKNQCYLVYLGTTWFPQMQKTYLIKFNIHLMKTLSKLGKGENFLNLIKAIYRNPTVNILLQSKWLNTSPINIRNKTSKPTFTTFISLKVSVNAINNRHPDWKEHLSLRIMTVQVGDLIQSIKRLLRPINEVSKVTGDKINMQKPAVFIYTNNNQKLKF